MDVHPQGGWQVRHMVIASITPVAVSAVVLAAMLLSGFALVVAPLVAGAITYATVRRSLSQQRAWFLAGASAMLAVPAIFVWMLLALHLLLGGGFASFE